MTDNELDRFKTSINLSEFAAGRGYALDRRESSRNSAVMRHPDGDKVIIAKRESGAWVYFSVRDDRDNGTIIDFLQNRGGGGLGDVRKTLRAWLGAPRSSIPVSSFISELLPVSRDRAAVMMAWERARVCAAVPYLTGRGLNAKILTLPRFSGRYRVDGRGNVLFPHYDQEGLCGFEIKNQDFTGFSAGGIKGLWFSQCKASDTCLVLAESAIDAISYFAMNPAETARYLSTGGNMNNQQPSLLRSSMEKMPLGSDVILAFDYDEGGEALAEEVAAFAPSPVNVRRVLPPHGKDWNEALKSHLGLE